MVFKALCLALVLLAVGLAAVAAPAAEQPQALVFRLLLAEKKCQLAIWLTDRDDRFLDTVYVTRKTAQKGLGNRGGELDDRWGGPRLSVLPVWAHQRGRDYGGGNFYPPKDQPLPDAVTSATPPAGAFEWTWRPAAPLAAGQYFFYVEVNKSFDKNEGHRYSWYRGQPSVVWRGGLTLGREPSTGRAQIIGHGHPAGADGRIEPDVSSLTTALELVKEAEASYKP